MNNYSSCCVRGFVSLILLLVVAACAETQPSRFYMLSGMGAPMSEAVDEGERELVIGLGPITLPRYLDRPQIVTRTSPNKMELAEFDKWAEPLGDVISRVMAENVSALLATRHVVILPQRRSRKTDYQVQIDVTQFDTEVSGKTVLVARWSVFRGRSDEPLATQISKISNSITNPTDYESVVAAMSQALGTLSRAIATAIRSESSS